MNFIVQSNLKQDISVWLLLLISLFVFEGSA